MNDKKYSIIRGLSRERSLGPFPEEIHKTLGLNVLHRPPGMGEFNHLDSPIDLHQNTVFLRNYWMELKEKNDGEWFILGIPWAEWSALTGQVLLMRMPKKFLYLIVA